MKESIYTDAQQINDDLNNLMLSHGLPIRLTAQVMTIAESDLRSDLLEIGERCEDIARKIREAFVRHPK